MTTTSLAQSPTESRVADVAKGAGIGIVGAVVANLVVFFIANAGAPVQIVANGETTPSDLPVGLLIGASIFPLIVGAVGLLVIQRFRADGFRIWAGLAAVLSLLSLFGPFSLDVDTGSKVALAIMHITTAAAAIGGHAVFQRTE